MKFIVTTFFTILYLSSFAQINPMEIDLYLDSYRAPLSSNPDPLAAFKDQLIFQIDQYDGKKELLITDGTEQGTEEIFVSAERNLTANFNPLSASNENNIYMNLNSSNSGFDTELYRYDGVSNVAELIYNSEDDLKALYPLDEGVLIIIKGDCGHWGHCDQFLYYDESSNTVTDHSDLVEGFEEFSVENILEKDGELVMHAITADQDLVLFANVNTEQSQVIHSGENRTTILYGVIDDHVLFSGKNDSYEGLHATLDGTTINLLLEGELSELNEFQWHITDEKLYIIGDRQDSPGSEIVYACDGNVAEVYYDSNEFLWGDIKVVYFFDGILFFEKATDFYAYDGAADPQALNYTGGFREIFEGGGSLFIRSAGELYRYREGADAQVVVDFIARDVVHAFEENLIVLRDKDIYKVDRSTGELIFIETLVAEPEDNFPFEAGDKVYFNNTDEDHAAELWATDVTPGTFGLVKDLNVGTEGLLLNEISSLGDKFFITAGLWNVGERDENRLMAFDHVTKELTEIYDQECNIETTGEYLIVTQEVKNLDSLDIFSTKGEPNDFVHLGKLPRTGFINTNPSSELFKYEDKVLINYDGGLMVTDGTVEGTFNLTNISINDDFIIYKDIFYFQAAEYSFPNQENQFWRTDGTVAGTYRLLDDEVDNLYIYKDYLLVHHDDRIYFNDGTSDEFDFQWLTDVDHYFSDKDNFYVVRNGELGTFPLDLPNTIDVNSYEFFEPIINVQDFVRGFELNGIAMYHDFYGKLFTTDGTAKGTHLVLEDFQTAFSDNILGEYEGGLFFRHLTDENGAELWLTDGTIDKTFMIEDLFPGTSGSAPKSAHVFKGDLYFIATHPKYGTEIFVLDNFFSPNLTGVVYEDKNENGMQDAGELGIPGIIVDISPDGQRTTTDENGNYAFEIEPGQAYELTLLDEDCWEYCLNEPITLDATKNPNFLSNYFVDIPACSQGVEKNELLVDLTSSISRCNTLGKHWVNIKNNSCKTQSGKVEIRFDHLDTLVNIDVPFDSLGGLYTFEFEELEQNALYPIDIVVQRGNETFTADTMWYEITSFLFEDGDYVEIGKEEIYQILRCSYDPNDKQVFPAREEESNSNYTQFDEKLTYKIRFQNTGNDTAYNVLITDTLSPLLDPSTFELIAASHPMNLQARNNGVLHFYFTDIFLVDSLTNEPESHGFVSFNIEAYDEIEELDEIFNTANIYFDFNDAIVTNTTKNTFVEFLDMDGDGVLFYEDCDDTDASIFPGAEDIPNNDIDEDCDGEDVTTFSDDDGDGVTSETDCDDTNPDIYPGAPEICNGIDDNCDGNIDEGLPILTYYADADQDGFGDLATFVESCDLPNGFVVNAEDCDDTDPNINPDAMEILDNGIDEDCDGEDLLSSSHHLADCTLNIYPNPTSDLVYINIDGQLDYSATVYDLTGRQIATYFAPTQLSLINLPVGSYMLEIKDLASGQSIIDKVVKVK